MNGIPIMYDGGMWLQQPVGTCANAVVEGEAVSIVTTVCGVASSITAHQQYYGLHCTGEPKGEQKHGLNQQCLPSTMGGIASYKILYSCQAQP
ncbi:unnamed protein product [Polarella glacialis]|uniref:Uncharacterized protein n=1 Tax=Polarella glacialis TaxID=89957 RepID=A0A813ELN1_POLGL|nr:unnamed protein product [Polarella glacialis]